MTLNTDNVNLFKIGFIMCNNYPTMEWWMHILLASGLIVMTKGQLGK